MKATYIPTCPPNQVSTDTKNTLRKALASLTGKTATRKNISFKKEELTHLVNFLNAGVEPEKLAAVLARCSRSNEGIEELLEKHRDSSPNAIFQFIDYGHASIGGLTGGIAIALSDISMLLAYKLFEFAQMADGQESSTRYIELNNEGIISPETLGLPIHLQEKWHKNCMEGFHLYKTLKERMQEAVDKDPSIARLPEKALRNPKVKDRMLKNYALDRCRYFLPVCTRTTLGIVATARVWADIAKLCESLMWPEAIAAAEAIRAELKKASPNLVRHSHADDAAIALLHEMLGAGSLHGATQLMSHSRNCECHLETFGGAAKFQKFNPSLAAALATRASRYSHPGTAIKRMTVRTEWSAVAIAELRDLNRHRTGFRFSNFAPVGFYVPDEALNEIKKEYDTEKAYQAFKENYRDMVKALSCQAGPGMQANGYFLGTQVPFEHTQQADKFLYEVELRTGLGAHFRYADHVRQAAEIFFNLHPETREAITLGEAEPE